MPDPADILHLLRDTAGMVPGETDADAVASSDLAAGRTADSDAVAAWLGGWHRARLDGAGGHGDPVSKAVAVDARSGSGDPLSTLSPPAVHRPLIWTRIALVDGDRLLRLLAHCGPDADRRLAAAIVTAMVRVIVDGIDDASGTAMVPVLPPLFLRLRVEPARLIAIGLRWQGQIT